MASRETFQNVPIEKIHVGDRHREDMGDLESLAQSIRELGLLQPIGINKFYELVFGARRLDACQYILNWTEIPCHIVDIDQVLLGEYAENEFRKDFTKSERVAIASAVEEELGKRQGQRTDQLPQFFAEVPKGETRDIAAKKAGFGNRETYRQAAAVVELGSPELIDAMDREEISVSAAEVIAKTTPKDKQAAVVAMPKDQRRTAVKDARQKLAEQQQRLTKDEAYRLRRFIEELSKAYLPPDQMWMVASDYLWPAFYEHVDNALRYLITLKEGHPNARKKLQSSSRAN